MFESKLKSHLLDIVKIKKIINYCYHKSIIV